MIRKVSSTLALAMLLPCGGCSHWKETGVRPDYLLETTHADRLRLSLADGSRFVVNDPVARADTLFGWRDPRAALPSGVPDPSATFHSPYRTASKESVQVPFSEIVGTEVRKGDPGGTALLVTGIIAGSIGLLAVAVAASGGISLGY
jgi:hypothetical protein